MKRLVFTILALTALVYGVGIGLIQPRLQVREQQRLELMQTLLPGSQSFTQEDYSGEDANITAVYKAENGFVIAARTRGYADEIAMLIGVDKEGRVTGLVVAEAHETLGLGSRVLNDHAFLAQFLNGNGSFAVGGADQDGFSSATGSAEPSGNETSVDAISGATVTSKAVIRCVNAAIAYVTGADTGSSATEWGG